MCFSDDKAEMVNSLLKVNIDNEFITIARKTK